MKRVANWTRSAAVAAIGFALATQATASAIPVVSVSTPAPTVNVGASVVVDINISGVSDLYGFQFDLGFDPSVLSAGNSSEGTLLPTGGPTFFIPGTIDNLGGNVAATADTLIGVIPGVTGNGLLATIDFTALGVGSSGLELANVILLDSQLNEIPDTLVNGSITVQKPVGSVPEPATLGLLALGVIGFCAARRRPILAHRARPFQGHSGSLDLRFSMPPVSRDGCWPNARSSANKCARAIPWTYPISNA
jgi:hypothetical protein